MKDLLQEHFIPLENFVKFMKNLRNLIKEFNIDIMQIAFRYIPHNTESFLSYSKKDCIGIVIFFNQQLTSRKLNDTKLWSQKVIELVTTYGGTFYLPMQLHADRYFIKKIYPEIDVFFNTKNILILTLYL